MAWMGAADAFKRGSASSTSQLQTFEMLWGHRDRWSSSIGRCTVASAEAPRIEAPAVVREYGETEKFAGDNRIGCARKV